ncbi:MAG TPA: NAD(P)H-binding protein [Roseiflexaceae bacterium]|nr:NAD(P)H-binding protein [Roseiflexaceae bacterium]
MVQPPILLALGPQIDYPGSLPNLLIGRQLATVLLDAGLAVRVLIDEAATGWPSGVEVFTGSVTRPSEVPAAFAEIVALFLAGADPATAYEALALARAGGAQKVVTLSSHGPTVEVALPPDHWHWLAIEVIAERSGLAWTHVVPSLVMGVTLTGSYPLVGASWHELITRGEPIRRPFADARVPFIHERDLAEIVAIALREPAYDGRTIHATGVGISDRERAQLLGDVLGHQIAFEPLTREQAEQQYREQGLDEDTIAYVLDTAAWFAEHNNDGSAEPESILGRPLRSYADWAREHAAAFV